MRAVLVGGPLDGVMVKLRARREFVWVDVRAGHTCYLLPKKHRVLYRATSEIHMDVTVDGVALTPDEQQASRRWVYLSAVHTHARCGGCGAYVETIDGHVTSCSLCGSALAPLQ